MTRLCVAGGSHVAAMKRGWESIGAEFPGTEIDFFAAGGDRFADLAVADGVLMPGSEILERMIARTANGKTAIANDYDAYAVCGLKCDLYTAVAVLREFRAGGDDDAPRPVSEAVLRAAVTAELRNTLAIATLHKVRAITKAPSVLIAAPMARDTKRRNRQAAKWRTEEGTSIAVLFHDACPALAAEAGAMYLRQPDATLATPMTTKEEYATGGIHLSGDRPEDDAHMNADYGAVVMRGLVGQLNLSRPVPRVLRTRFDL